MIVKLILGTKADPGAKVEIESNIKFTHITAFDQWIKAQKLARDWLARELARK